MIAKFTGTLQKAPTKGGWTYVVWYEAAAFFGTHGAVKVRGSIDGHPFQSSFMAMGERVQMLSLKAVIRAAIGKDVGESISVVIGERLVQ